MELNFTMHLNYSFKSNSGFQDLVLDFWPPLISHITAQCTEQRCTSFK